jgi:monoamine oxidase
VPAPGSQLTRDLRRLAASYRGGGRGPAHAGGDLGGPGQLSRRQVLVRGAQFGGAALLAGGATKGGARTGRDAGSAARVVIVGAGLAGLTCAYRLQQHGLQAAVYEARPDRVGGRCWSAREFVEGQVAEHGGEFIDTRHVHLRRLVSELGLRMDDRIRAQARERGVDSVLYLDGEPRVRSEVYADFPQVMERLEADYERVGDYRYDRASPVAIEFGMRSVRDWLDANVPGGSQSLLGRAITISQTGFFGRDPQDLSAINLFEAYTRPYVGADDRYHVHGGNDRVTRRLAARLRRGALRLDAPLRALWRRSDGTLGLQFEGVRRAVFADYVVLCLPFATLRRVDLAGAGLSARKRECIEELGMGTNAKVLVQFRDRFSHHHHWNGEFSTDQPVSHSWDSSLAEPGRAGLLTIYSGGRTGTSYRSRKPHGVAPRRVVRDALVSLDRMVPGISRAYNGHAWLDAWVRDPWSRGSYAAFLPGQYTRYWGFIGRPEGRIHFGGEHTSTYSQGYLNGGVESGERCAREVLQAVRARS